MKNIKDITISIFAIIGFLAIVSGFTTNKTEQEHTVPESHVWELQIADSSAGTNGGLAYLVNKVTGEVRKYSRSEPENKGANAYLVMKESQGRN